MPGRLVPEIQRIFKSDIFSGIYNCNDKYDMLIKIISKKGKQLVKFDYISLKRFGLCMLAVFFLGLYVQTTIGLRFRYYFPIGLALCMVYVWFVSTRLKKIYPRSQRAIGQLCLTFLLASFVFGFKAHKMHTYFTQEDANNFKAWVDSSMVAAMQTIMARIVGILLSMAYLVSLFKSYRRN